MAMRRQAALTHKTVGHCQRQETIAELREYVLSQNGYGHTDEGPEARPPRWAAGSHPDLVVRSPHIELCQCEQVSSEADAIAAVSCRRCRSLVGCRRHLARSSKLRSCHGANTPLESWSAVAAEAEIGFNVGQAWPKSAKSQAEFKFDGRRLSVAGLGQVRSTSAARCARAITVFNTAGAHRKATSTDKAQTREAPSCASARATRSGPTNSDGTSINGSKQRLATLCIRMSTSERALGAPHRRGSITKSSLHPQKRTDPSPAQMSAKSMPIRRTWAPDCRIRPKPGQA